MNLMPRIQIASTTYDIFVATHMFFIPIHILTALRQSVSTTFIFLLNALLTAFLYNYLQESKRLRLIKNGPDVVRNGSVSTCLVYFYRLQQMIDKNERADNFIVEGIL